MKECNQLYKQTIYLNNTFDFIKNMCIVEYDIQSAGLSIIKELKLQPKKIISWLDALDKNTRNFQIGILQRDDTNFAKRLSEGFTYFRKAFFEKNNVDCNKVLSIKKDAIFLINPCVRYKEFGYVKFIEKNSYSSYYYINNIQFYYNSFKNIISVKGINDTKLIDHERYMLDILKTIFNTVECGSYTDYVRYIKKFSKYYKERMLDINYYRELNISSLYRLNVKYLGNYMGLDYICDDNIDDIDISYNYTHYILPLINLLF